MNSLADMFRGVYNAMIPTAGRAYGEFLLGSNAPITERDIPPDMMKSIRARYLDQKQRNEADMARLRGQLDMTREEYAKYPEIDPIGRQLGDPNAIMPYEAAMAKYRQELARYKPGRTAISKYQDKYTNVDTDTSLLRHPYDPDLNAALTLGRYNVVETPEGPTVYDTYNFDNTPGNSLMSEGLVAKANALANIIRPGAKRDVRIRLNGR